MKEGVLQTGKESQEKVTELRDMLPTCTFYTGPSGIGKVEPTLPTKRDKKGQKGTKRDKKTLERTRYKPTLAP